MALRPKLKGPTYYTEQFQGSPAEARLKDLGFTKAGWYIYDPETPELVGPFSTREDAAAVKQMSEEGAA